MCQDLSQEIMEIDKQNPHRNKRVTRFSWMWSQSVFIWSKWTKAPCNLQTRNWLIRNFRQTALCTSFSCMHVHSRNIGRNNYLTLCQVLTLPFVWEPFCLTSLNILMPATWPVEQWWSIHDPGLPALALVFDHWYVFLITIPNYYCPSVF